MRRILAGAAGLLCVFSLVLWAFSGIPLWSSVEGNFGRVMALFTIHLGGLILGVFSLDRSMWKVEPKPEPPRVPWDTLHADYAATLVALSPEIANVLRAVDEYCDCRTGQPHSLPTTFDYKRRAKIADMVEQAIKIRRDAAIAKERERCLQEKKT